MILADFISKFNCQCFTVLDKFFSNIDVHDLTDSQLFFENLILKDRFFFLLSPTNSTIHEKLRDIEFDLYELLSHDDFGDIAFYDLISIGFYAIAHSLHRFIVEHDFSVFSVDVLFTYFLEFLDDYFRKKRSFLRYNKLQIVSCMYFIFIKHEILTEVTHFQYDFSLQFMCSIKYENMKKYNKIYQLYWSIISLDVLDYLYCFCFWCIYGYLCLFLLGIDIGTKKNVVLQVFSIGVFFIHAVSFIYVNRAFFFKNFFNRGYIQSLNYMQRIPYKICVYSLNTLLQTDISDLGLDFDLEVLLNFHELLDLDVKIKALLYLTGIYAIRVLSHLNLNFYFPFFIDSLGEFSPFGHFFGFLKHDLLKNLFVFSSTMFQ